jgi:hypothetical protein
MTLLSVASECGCSGAKRCAHAFRAHAAATAPDTSHRFNRSPASPPSAMPPGVRENRGKPGLMREISSQITMAPATAEVEIDVLRVYNSRYAISHGSVNRHLPRFITRRPDVTETRTFAPIGKPAWSSHRPLSRREGASWGTFNQLLLVIRVGEADESILQSPMVRTRSLNFSGRRMSSVAGIWTSMDSGVVDSEVAMVASERAHADAKPEGEEERDPLAVIEETLEKERARLILANSMLGCVQIALDPEAINVTPPVYFPEVLELACQLINTSVRKLEYEEIRQLLQRAAGCTH